MINLHRDKEYSLWLYPYTLSTLSTFPEFCEQKSQACNSGGIQTHDLSDSRAVSYQHDHVDCPVARGNTRCKNIEYLLN